MAITTRILDTKFSKEIIQDKLKTKITVEQFSKSNFFVVKWEKGKTPQALSGKYTSMQSAEKAVQAYLRGINQSIAAKYSKKDKEDGSTVKPEDNDNA